MTATNEPADSPPDFQIGLVLAGAISAGAYTAGVLDFLTEALGQLVHARLAGGVVPAGHARLRVLSGASAGGMSSGMLLGALARQAGPVHSDPGPTCDNPFFDAWVNRIDITRLLDVRDLATLAPDALPASLLDCSVLDDIARDVLRLPATMPPLPDWVAAQLEILLTVTNLRGVPYRLGFAGSELAFGMLAHADFLQFLICDDALAEGAEAPYRSAWPKLNQAPWLALLREAALATGAFPLALAPRVLEHRLASQATQAGGDPYSRRRWQRFRFWRDVTATDLAAIPAPPAGAGSLFGRDRVPLQMNWPQGQMPASYRFACVDGGVMDNEPLELARRVLTQGAGSLDGSGRTTNRALVMIAPFPGGAFLDDDNQDPVPGLLRAPLAIVNALVQQARFNPDELLDATDPAVFGRYLIAPSRDNAPGQSPPVIQGERAIACGSLGGFGGFLDRSLRLHDYFLGRRNCQSFLRHHFTLPADHGYFGAAWRADCQAQERYPGGDDRSQLAIIPLFGTAAHEVVVPPFPRFASARLDQVMAGVGVRYDALTSRAVRAIVGDASVARLLGQAACRLKRGKALAAIRARLQKGLQQHGLM